MQVGRRGRVAWHGKRFFSLPAEAESFSGGHLAPPTSCNSDRANAKAHKKSQVIGVQSEYHDMCEQENGLADAFMTFDSIDDK